MADSYKLMPWADVVYGCDTPWWNIHGKERNIQWAQRWSCHEQSPHHGEIHGNDKTEVADKYDVNLVLGKDGDEFSFDPSFIRYGSNAGFQAINLALLFGCTRIVLVGFDMRHVAGKSHFFGDHPPSLRRTDDEGYRQFARHYATASKALPKHVSIVNATPGSALTCFPIKNFDDATRVQEQDGMLYRDRPESVASAG